MKNVDEFGTLIKGAGKASDVLKHGDEVGGIEKNGKTQTEQ